MTDKFEVPAPSAEAMQAYMEEPTGTVDASIHAAMRVDAPALCLLEVQRFSEHLVHALFDPALAVRIRTAYLDYMERFRFPEAAPRWNQNCAIGCSVFQGVVKHVEGCPNRFTPSVTTEYRQALPGPCTCKGVKHRLNCPLSSSAPAQFVCVKGCGYAGLEANRCKNCPDVAAPPSEAPAMECRTCDGTGWTEGGTAIKTPCRACKGLGVAAARPEARECGPNCAAGCQCVEPSCTACACPRCVAEADRAFKASLAPAERDFLRELAKRYADELTAAGDGYNNVPTDLATAARKVVG